ncbi:MAG: T9SS type A sorting domain-containing protein [candidate division Zixibacteria bacterium]|nr:T9SS type A sorting domain-containing protein [candidate division Zixibacteria bacterium]
MKRKAILLISLATVVLFSTSFCQIPILDLVAIDTLDFEIGVIRTVEFVDYNYDEFKEYYIKTDSRSYLFDGESTNLIWQSPILEPLNNQSLHYIESIQTWRNYIVELYPYYEFRIKWFDIPDPNPVDSFTHFDSTIWVIDVPIDVGYMGFPNNQNIYIQMASNYFNSDWDYAGYCYVFNFHDHSLINDYYCWMPFKNEVFSYNNEYYLWHVGKSYLSETQPGPDLYLRITHVCIYDEDLNEINNYSCLSHYASKAELFYDNQNNSMKQLLSTWNGIKLYDNIFGGGNYYTFGLIENTYLADFIQFNNNMKVIYYVPDAYFELLNMDLTFSSYIQNDLPEGIIDIQTEDINSDGSDEVFCIYDDMIIICELQDNVGVDEPSAPLPAFHTSNHPNPFNASTTIEYDLPQPADVQITIFNILGQQIANLVDSPLAAGNHQVSWDAGDLPSGMYFYRIQAGEFDQTEKMLLLK